jgi:DNA-binding Xre family transcriptional regulator
MRNVERKIVMPSYIDIESALLRWQDAHHHSPTYEELAIKAGFSVKTLYRMMAGTMFPQDLSKILQLCKCLECDPRDIIRQK